MQTDTGLKGRFYAPKTFAMARAYDFAGADAAGCCTIAGASVAFGAAVVFASEEAGFAASVFDVGQLLSPAEHSVFGWAGGGGLTVVFPHWQAATVKALSATAAQVIRCFFM